MSNQQVGAVYQSIINDVIDTSRVDFEEGGVEESVLEELRLGWQQKLSQLQVATFPWDPKPEPLPITNPPTVPSNAGNYSHNTPPQHQNQGLTLPQMNPNQMQNQNQPRIKPEPEDNNGFQAPPSIPNGLTAQERAAHLLQNSYGPRAAQSIGKVRESAGVGQQGQGPPQHHQGPPQHQGHPQFQQGPPNPQLQHPMHMHPQQPQQNHMQQQQRPPQGMPMQQGQQGQRPQMTEQQYRAMLAQQTARQQAQLQSQNPTIKSAQNDGAGDEVDAMSVIKRFDSSGNEVLMGRVEIDGLLRSKIQAMGQSMEGGGLMLPLMKASTKVKRERKVVKRNPDGQAGGFDGGDEEDEDAINSDLDDPDDGLNDDDDDDDSMGHIMLCMYDKVQRVKNKWKCVMKDGVLTVNGKEYVFHKATGEYEW